MSNLIVVPLLISCAVVLVTFMMKKDEHDNNKKPNYAVLFIVTLCVSGGITYFVGGSEDALNIVMKEIDGGDAPF
jgi:hypothetical protein